MEGNELQAKSNVPAGHKIALMRIGPAKRSTATARGSGAPAAPIEPGEHIHTHNLSYEELEFAYEFPEKRSRHSRPAEGHSDLHGLLREDGRVGTRNYIAVVAASNCAAHTAELIAQSFSKRTLPPNIDGVVAFPHGEGCGMSIGAGHRCSSSVRWPAFSLIRTWRRP